MTEQQGRDTTFTKWTILALVGAVLLILYFVPSVLLLIGLLLFGLGMVVIAYALYKFRVRLRGYPAGN